MTPEVAARRWRLSDVAPLAETQSSWLWRAISPDHGAVVVKRLKPRGADEIHGARLMQALGGHGAARIHAIEGDDILMEHLPGPLLGDLVRRGDDANATEILADVAARIGYASSPGLVPLERHLRALLNAASPARELARDLLEKTPVHRPLHGDLHHDNILGSPRGWLAIDPKGLVGDPAFDLANSFRNPFDCQPLARDPARISRLASTYAERLQLDRARILGWAVVQCAVSQLWDREVGNDTSDDAALMPVLLSAREIG